MNITYEDIKATIEKTKEIIEKSKYIVFMSENTKKQLTSEQLKEIERCAIIKTVPANYLESEEKLIIVPPVYFDFKPHPIDILKED